MDLSSQVKSSLKKYAAFTLVELLVVIGIIALLIAILLPSLHKARQRAYGAACLSNQRQIVAAMIMYANDNKGSLPGPCLNVSFDPYNTNTLPGQTMSNIETWGGTASLGADQSGNTQTTGNWNANHNITSTTLLQRYLGGVGAREVWFCPANDSVRNAPCAGTSTAGYTGKQLGYGYRLNNDSNVLPSGGKTGSTLSGTHPAYLFGYWVVPTTSQVASWGADAFRPKKLTECLADPTRSGKFQRDPTRVWLITDTDCRYYDTYWSASFGIVKVGTLEASEATMNGFGYQPVHATGPRLPNDLGRNYAFLDGHAEYIGLNDAPGHVGYLGH